MASSNPTAMSDAWHRFSVMLGRFSEGPPLGKRGRFNARIIAVWRQLEGSVRVESSNGKVRARAGEWMVCRPGERYQEFSENARIVSIQFHVQGPAAVWSGPLATALENSAALERCLRRLRQTAVLKRLQVSGTVSPQRIPASFGETLEFQEAASGLFRQLLRILEARGVSFQLLNIRDPRVRSSHESLEAADFQEPFSRERLAAECGVSPSQLDRLWRGELGVTPRHYYDQRRFETACMQLGTGNLSIKEIAYAVGFRHLSRFSIWFRAQAGESPRSFRRRQQKG